MITFTDCIPIAVIDAWLITVLIMLLANFEKLVKFWKRKIKKKENTNNLKGKEDETN